MCYEYRCNFIVKNDMDRTTYFKILQFFKQLHHDSQYHVNTILLKKIDNNFKWFLLFFILFFLRRQQLVKKFEKKTLTLRKKSWWVVNVTLLFKNHLEYMCYILYLSFFRCYTKLLKLIKFTCLLFRNILLLT